MLPNTIMFSIGMKIFLILLLLCDGNISRAIYFENYSEPGSSADEKKTHLIRSFIPKYRIHSNANNRYNWRYRQNRGSYGDKIVNRQIQRRLHPHWYWHFYGLRDSNPSASYRSADDQPDNQQLSRYKHSIERSGTSVLSGHRSRNSADVSSRKLINTRDVVMSKMHGSRRLTAKRRRAGDSKQFHSNLNSRNSGLENVRLKETSADKNSTLSKLASHEKEVRRDLSKAKRASVSGMKTAYRHLRHFDLLYILGVIFITIPAVSILVIVVSLASCCWNSFSKRNRKERSSKIDNSSPKEEITLEAAIVGEAEGSKKVAATKSSSFKDMLGNFVSNDIEGDGDTVAKRMKLERWMMQGYQKRESKKQPKGIHRHFNAADMDSVAEEETFDSDSNVDSSAISHLNDASEASDDEGPKDARLDVNRPREKANRVTRQESRPFKFPEEVVAMGRVFHNARRPRSPRRMKLSYSIADMNPQRLLQF